METETVTVEGLQRRSEERRALATSQPAELNLSDTKSEPVTRECPKCHEPHTFTPLILNGRDFTANRVCNKCLEQDRDDQARLSALQRRHVGQLDGVDRERIIRDMLLEMGANPWEHGHASLDNFDPADAPKAVGAAREFAAAVKHADRYDPVRGLYLWGPTGTAKTHLAVGIVRWLLEQEYHSKLIVFDHAAELIARIQDTYGRKDERTMDVLEKRFNAGLWILDDFGTERCSDDVIRHLTLIFARRALRPNLITSNIGPQTLEQERPELMRVLSRLGPAYFRTVEVRGKDRRFD